MRSPGVIYRKYRNIKKRYLYEKILLHRKASHDNCFYGSLLEYTDTQGKRRAVRICKLNLKRSYYGDVVKNLDICTCPLSCNAFVPKTSKDTIKYEFEQELKDPIIKKTKYPELVELEWVLDKSLNEAKKNPSFLGKLIINIINLLENILKRVDGKRIKLGVTQED